MALSQRWNYADPIVTNTARGRCAQDDRHKAHGLRDVQYAIDCGDTLFAPGLKTLLRWATRVGRRPDHLKDSTLKAYRQQADCRLDELLRRKPPNLKGQALLAQTKKWRHAFILFLEDRTVPAPNTVSERALRPSVVHRKVTNGFRSDWGGQRSCSNPVRHRYRTPRWRRSLPSHNRRTQRPAVAVTRTNTLSNYAGTLQFCELTVPHLIMIGRQKICNYVGIDNKSRMFDK